MKRFISMVLAIMMFCGCMLFVSCDKEVPIPDGYQVYDNGAIAFAYPESWTKTDGSTVILVNETGIGNNITVVYEAKNDFYKMMALADFDTQIRPSLEAMGMVVSNPSLAQTKNDNGLALTKIAYDLDYVGVKMTQTLFIMTVGDRTYTVTVTENTPDAALVSNVFNTLHAK